MAIKRIFSIGALAAALSGCADMIASQAPAPVFGNTVKSQKTPPGPPKKSKTPANASKDVVKTQPFKESATIKQESLLHETDAPLPFDSETETLSSAEPALPLRQDKAELTPFVAMEETGPLSPAVGALVLAAKQNSQSGDLDSAASSMERAIRIEPRNAALFYRLALLRLKQSKPNLAEDLAKKSALLASTDNRLKKHCWLLIAHARELQHDFAGAKEARAKADGF